ncbi:hypothetical protein Scep_017257 [Stephania cephalantha]|uniref:Uncharacterized protein n=1 Tax=Stephania cephalantha TaxID=152367 RepID=A0AAP0IP92_9MAGN
MHIIELYYIMLEFNYKELDKIIPEACTEWQCPKTKFPPIRCMNASRGSSPGYNWIDL